MWGSVQLWRYLVAPLILSVLSGSLRAQELTLSSAVNRAIERNGRIKAADAAVRRARADRDTARALFFPSLSALGLASRFGAQTTINLDPLRQLFLGLNPSVPPASVPPFEFELSRQFSLNRVQLNLTWPVFTGGRILAANRAAQLVVTDATAQQLAVRDSLVAEVVSRYYGLRLAEEAVHVRDSALATLELHVKNARALEQQGQIAKAERLRAEVARAEAARERDAAIREAALARMALRASLGGADTLTPDSIVTSTPFFRLTEIPSIEEFNASAQQYNPGLQRLSAGRQRARQGVRAQQGRWVPEIALFGTQQVYQNDLTKYLNIKPKWAYGAIANWELFDGFARAKATQSARWVEREVEARETQARRDIRILIEQQFTRLRDAESQLASLDSTRSLAEESLRAQTKAFTAGLATSLDVADAQLALARVRLGRLAALYAYDQAFVALLQASGQIDQLDTYLQRAQRESGL